MVSVRQAGQVVIVRPEVDRLDDVSGRDVVHQLRDHVTRSAKLLLNMENVTYINSEALGYITTCCRRIRHHRGSLAFCCLQEGPRGVIKMTHLDQLLAGIYASEAEALVALDALAAPGARQR